MDCGIVRAEGKKRGEEKKENMSRLVLKHSIDGIEHLSFISGPHFSPTDSIPLPFKTEDEIRGNSCRGLLYFSSYFETDFEDGKVVICNLATKKLKLLTPPCYDAFYCDHGLGYDPVSDDYKVVRNHNPATTAEVYSLRNDCWRTICGPGDDLRLDPECGVYLYGVSYWVTDSYTPEDGHRDFILAFNFTTESFSRMPLPPALRPPVNPPLLPGQYDHKRFKVHVLDCDGCLGVVGWKRLADHNGRVARHFELWVYRGGESWEGCFSVVLLDVERPLGVVRDGRLFLEGTNSCGHRHLMVYDWVNEELKEHAIYVEPPSRLVLLSYVENPDPLIDRSAQIPDEPPQKKKAGRMVMQRCSSRRREKA